MSYFPVIKIVDADGNIIYLGDTENLLNSINEELKAIRILLSQMADINLSEEDVH